MSLDMKSHSHDAAKYCSLAVMVTPIVCLAWPRPLIVRGSLHGGFATAGVATAFYTRSHAQS